MKYIYKIYSGYDGFKPSVIPDRFINGRYLKLGWHRYIDELKVRDKVWVFFHGPHAFENGVYVKGFVSSISRDDQEILLRVREYEVSSTLTDKPVSLKIEELVSVKYRQVFLKPESWDIGPECNLESCKERRCDQCSRWGSLGTITADEVACPERLSGEYNAFVPAYWIVPSRCYLFYDAKTIKQSIKVITQMFGDFKLGEKYYSYPLGLGIYEALKIRDLLDFDYIIPIPLSPDKKDAGEINRTLLLARELARLLGSKVKEAVNLTHPISKRAMQSEGYTTSQFEKKYYSLLEIVKDIPDGSAILLVDDVCTRGSTLSQTIKRLNEHTNDLNITAATVGQMIVKSAVNTEENIIST